MPIPIRARTIPKPIVIRNKSCSKRPMQIRAMLRAGTKLDKGMGSGKHRKAAARVIPVPQKIWPSLELLTG